MAAESYGECTTPDDANVPVNCFLSFNEVTKVWVWTADNYMPRKGYCSEGAYRVVAQAKKDVLAWVAEHVVPLYEAATHNLKVHGANYYWEKKPEE